VRFDRLPVVAFCSPNKNRSSVRSSASLSLANHFARLLVIAQADEGAMAQMPGVCPFDERDLAHAARNSAKPNAGRCGSRLSSTPSQSRRVPVYQDCESADCGSVEANRKSTLTRCMTDKRGVQVQLAFILSSRQFCPPAGTEKRCVARAVAPAWTSAAGRVIASHQSPDRGGFRSGRNRNKSRNSSFLDWLDRLRKEKDC
jgi:hypothetical protein